MNQKAAKSVALLIFTDLDGSLMEHETYSIEAARPALAELGRRDFQVVMNSSKTAAEMRALQEQLQLQAPFVCENGAALYPAAAGGEIVEFGLPRGEWLPRVHALRAQRGFNFQGFADWDPTEISELTGLPLEQATLASQRQYSEPILWRGSAQQRQQFASLLGEMGLQMLEGGRFFSIQGPHSKADAMTWLARQEAREHQVVTVALGDSPNDTAMLDAADIAVVIKSAKSERIELHNPDRILHTHRPGPAGWHDAITEILESLDKGELARN